MEKKSIITWKDVFKLALGIFIGLTSTLVMMKYFIKDETKTSIEKQETNSIVEENISSTDTIETHYYDSSIFNYVPSVEEILIERDDLRYANRVDSIYMAMPEDILIKILVTKGTTITVDEIVEEYLKSDVNKK